MGSIIGKSFPKESVYMIEAIFALLLLNWLLGFEYTVLIALAFILGHVFRISELENAK